MKILLHYLSRYRGLVFLSFLLAALNTGFSLCDPILFGKLIDFVKGVFETTAVKETVDGVERITRYNFPEGDFVATRYFGE